MIVLRFVFFLAGVCVLRNVVRDWKALEDAWPYHDHQDEVLLPALGFLGFALVAAAIL